VIGGFPSSASTVPDGFWHRQHRHRFDQGVGIGSQNYVMFMPDGSSQDTLGNLNSGLVYVFAYGSVVQRARRSVFWFHRPIRGWHLYNASGTPSGAT